ncbi:hypothetical protein QF001_002593 [Paraburkholderia youngii]
MQVIEVPVDENPRGLFLCARFVALIASIGETTGATLIVCSLMARAHLTGAS